MGGSTHGHLSAKYREKGPKDAWAETTRGSSNNSTLFEANAQPKIFQEQPIQCTGETIKRSPATVPIQAASYAIPKPTPKHQPEWSFADPLAASMAASTPSQLLHRTTLQPITFGNFLRNYLAELRAVALQAKLEAGMTPEAIKAEATQHAKDFERGWKQTEIPGFKDMLVMARARYAVKREDAEEEWYQMKQAARLVEGRKRTPQHVTGSAML